MSTWPNRGVPPAAWQGPDDKKQQPKTNSPNRLTHRNTDSPGGKEFIARRGLDPRGAAFSREELATWRDVAIHVAVRRPTWIASFLSMNLLF